MDSPADEIIVESLEQRQVESDLQAVDTDLLYHCQCFFIVAGDLRVRLQSESDSAILGIKGNFGETPPHFVPGLQKILVS
jgi:hypothetical protein